MRPLSQHSNSAATPKPEFQTKFKSRVSSHEVQDWHSATHSRNFSLTQRDPTYAAQREQNFNKTTSRLLQSNFEHLKDKSNLEADCTCGRHLGKFNVVKPDMTKQSIYQKSFTHQMYVPNIVNHDKEYDKLQGPHLDINSTYRTGFTRSNGDKVERPLPEDLLHSNGPCPKLSSYTAQFPGYKGDNQYVKPTDKHTRGYFPLRSRSTYAKEFHSKDAKKDDYTYFPDQLRTGSRWFGKTSYGDFYSNPNSEYMAKKVKIIEKLDEKPDFTRQYGTYFRIQKRFIRTIS